MVFDIVQLFPSLNHLLSPLILNKVGFNPKVLKFSSNYLIGRKIQYMWNNLYSSFFVVNIGVRQGSALSPIYLALYLSSLFYIFEKCVKNLKIPIFFLSFIDDNILISQENSFEKTDLFLFCNYNIVSFLLDQFGLAIEHEKTKVFYFSRSHGNFNLSPLDLSYGNTWISFSTESLHFANTLIFIPTKLCP